MPKSQNNETAAKKPRTKNECKKIGIRMAHGEIFHSAMCNRQQDIPIVFMVLAFAEKKQLDDMIEKKVAAFYEEMKHRQYRSVNGMPTFFSCGMLSVEENSIVIDSYNEEIERMKKLDEEDCND